MGDSIEILNDLDEVIKRKQQEVRERKQKQAEAKRLEDERTGKSVVRDEEKSAGKSVAHDENARPDTGSPTNLRANTEAHNNGDRMKVLNDFNEMIERKQREEKEAKQAKRKPKPTRAAVSRENGAKGQGPITPEGKAKVSANSLKHGFFANVEKLHPQDAPAYQQLHQELSYGLLPYGAVEELMVRELAMLTARLRRLEAAEYAIFCSELEAPAPTGDPKRKGSAKTPSERDSVLRDQEMDQPEIDSRSLAAAFLNTHDQLLSIHRIEAHLRRAYNRTWDRLRMLQKERKKFTPQELSKQTQQWINAKRRNEKLLNRPG